MNQQATPSVSSTNLQGYLESMRNVYERARERINGTDQEWKPREEILRTEVATLVKTFQPDDPASKAVFIIGKIQAAMKELDAPRLIVKEYEHKRKQYSALCVAEGKAAVQF